MRTASRILRSTAAAWLLIAAPAWAQFGPPMAPYARVRAGAEEWAERGGGFGYGGPWGAGWGGGWGGGFANPYGFGFAGPIVQGSWYQRPYPYHFDYYRYRWGGAAPNQVYDVPPPGDCPCAETPTGVVP